MSPVNPYYQAGCYLARESSNGVEVACISHAAIDAIIRCGWLDEIPAFAREELDRAQWTTK